MLSKRWCRWPPLISPPFQHSQIPRMKQPLPSPREWIYNVCNNDDDSLSNVWYASIMTFLTHDESVFSSYNQLGVGLRCLVAKYWTPLVQYFWGHEDIEAAGMITVIFHPCRYFYEHYGHISTHAQLVVSWEHCIFFHTFYWTQRNIMVGSMVDYKWHM